MHALIHHDNPHFQSLQMCPASGVSAPGAPPFWFEPPLLVCAQGRQEHRRGSNRRWGVGSPGRDGSARCRAACAGPIYIDDEPVLAQTIPQSTWWKRLSGPSHEILLKERSQCLDCWLIQGSKKATERGAMGQSVQIS